MIIQEPENCPKCGHGWYGECPREPWYVEWHCENCGYGESQYYEGEKMVISEGSRQFYEPEHD